MQEQEQGFRTLMQSVALGTDNSEANKTKAAKTFMDKYNSSLYGEYANDLKKEKESKK
ncbi:hypothetical protein [Chitinophaga pinensis]|uniref:hypothetical protein n=1 Tax=Chitinophaga pinensis TaxID=79329 RepID=UPI0021BDCE4C|nr:hypothetical protein [Chitinophaga pinensis]